MKNKFLALVCVTILMSCAHPIADYTQDGKNICPVHGVVMDKVTVPIQYGERVFDGEYEEARRELFPHNQSSVNSGLCVREKEQEAMIWHCFKCDEAEKAWRQKDNR